MENERKGVRNFTSERVLPSVGCANSAPGSVGRFTMKSIAHPTVAWTS